MSLSSAIRRREFLVQTASATAGALGVTGLAADVFADEIKNEKQTNRKRKRRARSVHKLKEGHFKDHVGDKFKVSGLRHDVILKLVAVHGHKHDSDSNRPIHIRPQTFSLLFVAPHDEERLTSSIHEFEHPDFGEVDLFLHEVMADDYAKTRYYEVVFN